MEIQQQKQKGMTSVQHLKYAQQRLKRKYCYPATFEKGYLHMVIKKFGFKNYKPDNTIKFMGKQLKPSSIQPNEGEFVETVKMCYCCNQVVINTQEVPNCYPTQPNNQICDYQLDANTVLFFSLIRMIIYYLSFLFLIQFIGAFTLAVHELYQFRVYPPSEGLEYPPYWLIQIITLDLDNIQFNINYLETYKQFINTAMIVFSIIFFHIFRKYHYNLYKSVENDPTQDGYTIFVQNIPNLRHKNEKSANLQFNDNEMKIKELFQKIIKMFLLNIEKDQPLKVHQKFIKQDLLSLRAINQVSRKKIITSINLCFDCQQLQKLQEQRQQYMQKEIKKKQILLKTFQIEQNNHRQNLLDEFLKDSNKINKQIQQFNNSEIKLLKNYILSQSNYNNNHNFLGKAFYSFQYTHFREYVMEKYFQDPKLFEINGEILKLSRAPYPTQVNWKNLKTENSQRFCKLLIIVSVLLVFLILATVLISFIQSQPDIDKNVKQMQQQIQNSNAESTNPVNNDREDNRQQDSTPIQFKLLDDECCVDVSHYFPSTNILFSCKKITNQTLKTYRNKPIRNLQIKYNDQTRSENAHKKIHQLQLSNKNIRVNQQKGRLNQNSGLNPKDKDKQIIQHKYKLNNIQKHNQYYSPQEYSQIQYEEYQQQNRQNQNRKNESQTKFNGTGMSQASQTSPEQQQIPVPKVNSLYVRSQFILIAFILRKNLDLVNIDKTLQKQPFVNRVILKACSIAHNILDSLVEWIYQLIEFLGRSINTLLITFITNVIGYILVYMMQYLTDRQERQTLTKYQNSYLIKLFACQMVNSIVIYIITPTITAYFSDNEKSFFLLDMNYLQQQGRDLVIFGGIFQIFVNCISIDHIRRRIKLFWKYGIIKSKLRMNMTRRFYTFQSQFNKDIELPDFNLADKYSFYLNTLYVGIFYANFSSGILPATIFYLTIFYQIDKRILYKFSSKLSKTNYFSFQHVYQIFQCSLVLFIVSKIFVWIEMNQIFNMNKSSEVFYLIILIIGALHIFLVTFGPDRLQRKLFGYNYLFNKLTYDQCKSQRKFLHTYWTENPTTKFIKQIPLENVQHEGIVDALVKYLIVDKSLQNITNQISDELIHSEKPIK